MSETNEVEQALLAEAREARAARDLAVTERDTAVSRERAATERAAHLEIAAEVEALVGVKIAPYERETFIDLAKTKRSLYERMVAERKDLGIAGRIIQKGGEAPNAVRSVSGGDAGDELLRVLESDFGERALPAAVAHGEVDIDLADLL